MSQKQFEWDKYFLEMARLVSTKSKDSSTKCGCVLVGESNQVLSTGYNGLTRGVEYDDVTLHERPEKYYWYEHSERNAIYSAAAHGIALKNSKAYVTGPPCHDCARALVQSGIKEIIIPVKHNFIDKVREGGTWKESCERSMKIVSKGNVIFREVAID